MSVSADPSPAPVKPFSKRPLLLILAGSLALHVIGGLVIGGIAIFRILKPSEAEIVVVPPPEAIQPRQRQYQVKTMRTQRATALPTQIPLTVDNPSDIALPNIDVPEPNRGQVTVKARGSAGAFGEGLGTGTGDGGMSTLFGNVSPIAGALKGTFIDFKQDRNREEAPEEDGWMDDGEDFLKRWRLREFRRYFNAPQSLYATHFYIPIMDANEAPRAYGVEHLVEPSHWIAVYQGKFRSPVDGRFRFVGTADDILIIGVDEAIVISAGYPDANPSDWEPKKPRTHPGPQVSEYIAPLTYGDWFTLKADEPRDLTIVVGERPGGEFASYLFIQQDGVDYETTGDGRPILPVFKLKEFSTAERRRIEGDGYPKRLDGHVFGYY